jgi:hypothetical protein
MLHRADPDDFQGPNVMLIAETFLDPLLTAAGGGAPIVN